MQLPGSTAAAESLGAYARDRLAESAFFADLSASRAHPEHVRDVFGQYCLWRGHCHRWFGVCVVKSPPAGDEPGPPRALAPLIACLEREIRDNDRGLTASFLASLGIATPARIPALPVTSAYAERPAWSSSASPPTPARSISRACGKRWRTARRQIPSGLSRPPGWRSGSMSLSGTMSIS